MIEQVKRLCALDGVSGHEQEICRYLCEQLAASPAEMEVVCDPLGNLLARVKGKRRAEKQVMFAAHMDEDWADYYRDNAGRLFTLYHSRRYCPGSPLWTSCARQRLQRRNRGKSRAYVYR